METVQTNLPQRDLPNSTGVLVLGILSILSFCCFGIIGLILAIIALVLAKKDMEKYQAEPELYKEGSYKNLKAGKIMAIIGLVLSILVVGYYLWLFIFAGEEFWQEFWNAYEQAREGQV